MKNCIEYTDMSYREQWQLRTAQRLGEGFALSNISSREVLERTRASLAATVFRYSDVAVERGEGCYLYDYEGRRYLDFAAGICVNNVGHRHPEVVAAAKQQIERFTHVSSTGIYLENVVYAEKLKELAPPRMRDGKVLWINSGSEAVETGLKMARMVTGRPMIIAFMGGFHGRPMGALAATASAASYRNHITSLLVGVQHAFYPYCYRCPLGHKNRDNCDLACLSIVRRILTHTLPPQDLAGILVEPVAGEGGYLVPPREFLQGLRDICDETGALLIFDEIQTGIGRTGKFFGWEHFGVEPDILCLAKALGGGLPLGAVISRKDLFDRWPTGSQGTTFGGNPVSCVTGLKTVEIILRDNLMENATKIGEHIRNRFREAQKVLPAIGDVRGLGMMIGVEIINPDGKPAAELIKELVHECGERGVIVTKCGASVIRICPPLTLSMEQADAGVDVILEVIEDLLKRA